MENINQLNLKEKTAIELRYLGNTMKEIAEKTETLEDTVEGWFRSGGKLFPLYQEYSIAMNEKRQKDLEDEVSVSDKEFFVITTNIVRQIGKRIQGGKVPLVNKKGQAIADDEGKPIMVNIPPSSFHTKDLKNVWQIQRLMKGQPINYEKQDITQTSLEDDAIVHALGLTSEDFNDDKINETTGKILKYLNSQ